MQNENATSGKKSKTIIGTFVDLFGRKKNKEASLI